MADVNSQTFVVRPGLLRVIGLSLIFIVGACVFLFLAAVAAAIEVASVTARILLLLLALLLAGLAVYFLLALVTSAVRIDVGPARLKLRIPRASGPLPLPSLIRAELSYRAIKAVECRDEIYDSFGLVTVQRAYSLLTQDGVRIPLGIMTVQGFAQLPYDKAAELIATRAGVSVSDRGAVQVGGIVRAMLQGVPPWDAQSMTPVERAVWHGRAARTVQVIVALVAATLALRACFGS